MPWFPKISRHLFTAILVLLAPALHAQPAPANPEAVRPPLVADGWDQRNAYRAKISELLKSGKYADLEQLAEKLRQGELRPDGSWRLPDFYAGLTVPQEADSMEDMRARLEAYRKAFPQSQTPVIALGKWWVDYAWSARGTDWGYRVPATAWPVFRERLAEARKMLESIPPRQVNCPEWYSVMQTVALGQQWDRAEYEELFSTAVARWPGYYDFYTQKAHFLEPRWYGKKGEWEAFARQAAAAHPDGDMLYFRIVRSQLNNYFNIYEETDVSWKQVKRGAEQLLAKYPESSWNAAFATRLAFDAGDYATLARWSSQLQGVVAPNGPLTPGVLKFAQQMASDHPPKIPNCIFRWNPDESECKAVVFLPGDLVAVGTKNGGVFVFDPTHQKATKQIYAMGGPISKFGLSPDGRLLAICRGSHDDSQQNAGEVVIYDLVDDKVLTEITGWQGSIMECDFSGDGQTLFMVGGVYQGPHPEMKAWDRRTGKTRDLSAWAAEQSNFAVTVAAHPTRPLLAMGWADAVRVWNYETGEVVFKSERVIEPGEPLHPGEYWLGTVWSVRFSPDGSQLLAGTCPAYIDRGRGTGGLTVWDTKNFHRLPAAPDDRASGADRVRYSADGSHILSNDQSGMLILRDADTREILALFPSGQEYVKDLAFSPDGCFIASAGRDHTVAVWNAR